VDLHERAARGAAGVPFRRAQRQAGHRGDRRQRFAAETQRGDPLEILGRAQLARGVVLEGEQGVLVAHPLAVVPDGDALPSAPRHLDVDAGGAGVERVLHELLDDGRRPLHDFARGDLVDHLFRQHPNFSHCFGSGTG